jgi:hypothetical protein
MRRNNKRALLIAVLLSLCLIGSKSLTMSQAKRISFGELLTWIQDDETKTDIKNRIAQRKLDFDVTGEALNKIKAKWKEIKLRDIPADLEQCIKDNAALPEQAQPVQPKPPVQTIVRESPKPTTVTLTVDCINAPCDISMNGKSFGSASPNRPFTRDGLTPGRVALVATASGYKDEKSTITPNAGERPTVTFEFQKLTGGININCEPGDCEVYLDNNRVGTTNQKQLKLADLSLGDHNLEVRKNGFNNLSRKITVTADVQSVEFEMKKTITVKVSLAEVQQKMLEYFSIPQGGSARLAYIATYIVNPSANPNKQSSATETVSGSSVSWARSEYSAKLEEHSALFNLYDILNRIAKNELKASLEGVDEATRDATKNVAGFVSDPPEYVRLIAEDNTDRYELTLENFDPAWVPVVLRQQKKNDPKKTAAVVCPVNKYAIKSGLLLPEIVKILNPSSKSMTAEYQARLDKVDKK